MVTIGVGDVWCVVTIGVGDVWCVVTIGVEGCVVT